ncbi:cupin domain-containing protein [Hymenobacter tibetensis]|uniref:Cupin domain-containing protein n=1 Tax=Hymenobacter tibetensis TaxID=497967 RepID=A0ABY4CV82_9BACT|nr:cupin domain-containing protein [Hymenobacter tibetensis]UOG73065.1 cupin domain-containing protein [Hymenobacter tibetensis]
MERRKFVLTTLAAPFVALTDLPAEAAQLGPGFKVKAGEARHHGHIKPNGPNSTVIEVKISGKDSDGGLFLFEQTNLSPGRGLPLHVHAYQDEVFYVLEGEFYFQLGQEKYTLTAGDSIFMPRKIPHSWIQISPVGRTMVTLQPAGKLEDLFLAFAALKSPPTSEEATRIFAAHDIQVIGPPVTKE